MLTLRSGPAAGLAVQVALLAALGLTVGLSALGWVVGLTSGVVLNLAVAYGLTWAGAAALTAADLVTLVRATLACGVAALVADAFLQRPAVTALVALATVALVLDAVDGWLARRTRTASLFGARFDGEVDAFLILVLSVFVARSVGGWVLALGAARYLFAAAGWLLPWLRRELPFRYWRKVVTATVGVVLASAAAGVLPRSWTSAALAVALVLLAESFGRDVWWLWRRRPGVADRPAEGSRGRLAFPAAATDTVAFLLVWFALVVPNQTEVLTPSTFLRIPIEGLVVAGLALVLPLWGRRTMAALVGVILGLVTLVKVLDMGFFAALDRPFNVVTDLEYFSPVRVLVRDAVGPVAGDVVLAAAVVVAVAVLVCIPLSLARLTTLIARHRSGSARSVVGLAGVWVVCAVLGLQTAGGQAISSASTGRLAVEQVHAATAAVRDQQRFDAAVGVDPLRQTAGRRLLTGLRGKDVLVAFVESYGRVAVAGSSSSARVRAVLDAGARRLRASGYSSRSAYLTSPTFGGLSWLAHSTLQSGLWVSDQGRYDRLLSSSRSTLSRLFQRAGWRTVSVMPSNRAAWPEGKRFYRFDRIYDAEDFGYLGPTFGFSRMPDQYALSVFAQRELARRDRTPVMAQIELASSHAPWAPVPTMVDWDRLGAGAVFDRLHDRAESATELWRHPERIEAGYFGSITYSLRAVISFVETYGDEDLVLIVVGDHQPATVITGDEASRDVPVTVIAHDPGVVDGISGWAWQRGMSPGSLAPVWPMDTFRDRFVEAFSPRLPHSASRALRPRP
ncbi:MAG: CDP-alcohol phosphatidyltransferase family protein [Actinomycetota bacterium]|nr:CDP-alcohol phosphatidyltransferase family protein [Actinomycetota bacterium]